MICAYCDGLPGISYSCRNCGAPNLAAYEYGLDMATRESWTVEVTIPTEDLKKRIEELKNSPPRPGSIRVCNEREQWSWIPPEAQLQFDRTRHLKLVYDGESQRWRPV